MGIEINHSFVSAKSDSPDDTLVRPSDWNADHVVSGAKEYHGMDTHGSLSFDNTSHILTLASGTNTYWFQGVKYTTSSAITCDLDETADRDHVDATLTANTMYFFYFKDATGKLYWSPTPWAVDRNYVMVATVFWNGSAGAVSDETHGYDRDIQWHHWAHDTIGSRIHTSDFSITAPSVASPSTVDFAGGEVYDEDLEVSHGQQTNCRIWYQNGASSYTFEDSNSIYPSIGVARSDPDNSYTLTAVNAAKYINTWVYASTDISRGIYVVVETRNAGYDTVAQARATNPPSLAGNGLTTELKLLYRLILKGDESFVEYTDYRSTSSVPAGGSTSPTASSVSFTPSGNVSSTNVQGAIEELDNEKASTTTSFGITIDGGGSAITTGVKGYIQIPFSCTITEWTILGDQSGSIVIDVWKDTYANYPPTNDDSITASATPTITTATKNNSSTLTGWTTSVSAGDCIGFNVDSCSSITRATLILKVTKTS